MCVSQTIKWPRTGTAERFGGWWGVQDFSHKKEKKIKTFLSQVAIYSRPPREREGGRTLTNGKKQKCVHGKALKELFYFFKLHRGPEAPSGDKSYLYNATSSRSLINITVSFIAAKCPRVFEHEERLECGALNIRAAAEETRGHKPRPFMCLRAGGRLTSLRFTLVNFCLAADVSAGPSRF